LDLVVVTDEVLDCDLLALAGGVLSTKSSLESVRFFLAVLEVFLVETTSAAIFLG